MAVLLAGTPPTAPALPAVVPAVAATSPCSAGAQSKAAFDCCLHLTFWKAAATTPLNHPAESSQDGAAGQKEGR
ncbi:MAG: hypothetical protein JSS55_07450 [Proteobacteria bacterium]|nr:hypothetical protein [Pseudomonadota bacterium]